MAHPADCEEPCFGWFDGRAPPAESGADDTRFEFDWRFAAAFGEAMEVGRRRIGINHAARFAVLPKVREHVDDRVAHGAGCV
jgi:hypothetical protein